MAFDLPTLRMFEDTVRKQVPAFKLGFKDQSFLQKAIGFLFPFNPSYMKSFITTFYPTVYFPSQAYYEGNPWSSMLVLAHEMVHLVDTMAQPVMFRLLYVMPQILALVGFVTFGVLAPSHAWIMGALLGSYVLACALAKKSMPLFYVVAVGGALAAGTFAVLLTHWVSIALFAGLVCVGPWPSAGRVKWELRGYAMNLAIVQWNSGEVSKEYKDWVLSNFTGPAYYFMSWKAADTSAAIDTLCNKAKYGQLLEHPYDVVYDFLQSQALIKK